MNDAGSDRSLPGGRWRAVLAVALAGVMAFYALILTTSSDRATCAVCRADRTDHRCLGLRWADLAETECSRWYRANVEPAHEHAWSPLGSCRRIGIPGLYRGFACRMGGPITNLSTRVQVEIYQHFDDRLEAKRLFLRLARVDGEGGPLWEPLMGWVDAGYPGTWRDWRERSAGRVAPIGGNSPIAPDSVNAAGPEHDAKP